MLHRTRRYHRHANQSYRHCLPQSKGSSGMSSQLVELRRRCLQVLHQRSIVMIATILVPEPVMHFTKGLSAESRRSRRDSSYVSLRRDREPLAEDHLRIVFGLEMTKFLHSPWLITIHGLERLVTSGVIDVCCRLSLRLAGIPQVYSFLSPFSGEFLEPRAFLDDGVKVPRWLLATR